MLALLKKILPGAPSTSLPFDLTIKLAYEVQAESEVVFNFQPARTAHQQVQDEDLLIEGDCKWEASTDAASGNRLIRMRAAPGALKIDYRTRLEVTPAWVARGDMGHRVAQVASPSAMPYLIASRYCESDKLLSFADVRFSSVRNPYARARAICEWVQGNLQFTPGVTDWHTSAVETFAERRGVCRDFAHLMIALCRASNIPARFVTGLDFGCSFGEPDFHAYVEVLVGERWYLFDPTGLCPRPGLIRIATGRDAADAAFATFFGPITMQSMQLGITPVGTTEEEIRALDRPRYGISTATNAPSTAGAPQPATLETAATTRVRPPLLAT